MRNKLTIDLIRFRDATKELTTTQVGAFIQILFYLQNHDELPKSDRALARIVGTSPMGWQNIKQVVMKKITIKPQTDILEPFRCGHPVAESSNIINVDHKKDKFTPVFSCGHPVENLPNDFNNDLEKDKFTVMSEPVAPDLAQPLHLSKLTKIRNLESKKVSKKVNKGAFEKSEAQIPDAGENTASFRTDLLGSPLLEPTKAHSNTIGSQSQINGRGGARKKPAIPLPDTFELSMGDRSYAERNGLSREEVDLEFERFKNSALAHGRMYSDWHRAWQNWVISPFRTQPQNRSNGLNGHARKEYRKKPDYSYNGRRERLAELLAGMPATLERGPNDPNVTRASNGFGPPHDRE